MRFLKYLPAEQFIGLLKGAACLVGNSSTGLKECSYLGVPVVNIGTRQQGRLRGPNVMDVPYDTPAIKAATLAQLRHGPYKPSLIYYKPDASKQIAEILAMIPLYTQKYFFEPPTTGYGTGQTLQG